MIHDQYYMMDLIQTAEDYSFCVCLSIAISDIFLVKSVSHLVAYKYFMTERVKTTSVRKWGFAGKGWWYIANDNNDIVLVSNIADVVGEMLAILH